jgi:putative CRISPR-associated protein (TIGR02619 family)
MTTIITTTGISLYLNTRYEHNTQTPTEDQMRQYLRVKPERASAEANSLLQIAQSGDDLVFLHTATVEAERCVRLLKEFFENRGFNHNHIHLVPLQFQEDEQHIETLGLRSLVNALIDEIERAQRNNEEVVINATAGLKLESGYSTMIGMLYQVPVKYIHEKFRRVVTFNPIALDWDTSLFLSYDWFFRWLDDQPRTQPEIVSQLKDLPDQERIKTLLTSPDEDGEVFLSPLGEALHKRFTHEIEEAELMDWPPSANIENIDDKISSSLLKSKHHPIKNILAATRRIAELTYVREIIGGNFEPTKLSRIKQSNPDGTIHMLWADDSKAANLIIFTTAQGRPQTLKVANKIRELLEIK